jgi:hypothetical protein
MNVIGNYWLDEFSVDFTNLIGFDSIVQNRDSQIMSMTAPIFLEWANRHSVEAQFGIVGRIPPIAQFLIESDSIPNAFPEFFRCCTSALWHNEQLQFVSIAAVILGYRHVLIPSLSKLVFAIRIGHLSVFAMAGLAWSASHWRPLLEQVWMARLNDVCELLIIESK